MSYKKCRFSFLSFALTGCLLVLCPVSGFSLELTPELPMKVVDNYQYPCLPLITEKQNINLKRLSTIQLTRLMNQTALEVRRFLKCVKAEKINQPMEVDVNQKMVTFVNISKEGKLFFSSTNVSMTMTGEQNVHITKYYEDGDTFFIPEVLNRKTFEHSWEAVAHKLRTTLPNSLNHGSAADAKKIYSKIQLALQSTSPDALEMANFELNGMKAFGFILEELSTRDKTEVQAALFVDIRRWANHTNIFVKRYVDAARVLWDQQDEPTLLDIDGYLVRYYERSFWGLGNFALVKKEKVQSLPLYLLVETEEEKNIMDSFGRSSERLCCFVPFGYYDGDIVSKGNGTFDGYRGSGPNSWWGGWRRADVGYISNVSDVSAPRGHLVNSLDSVPLSRFQIKIEKGRQKIAITTYLYKSRPVWRFWGGGQAVREGKFLLGSLY